MKSDDCVAGMKSLDPSWQQRQVVIDAKLVDEVCGGKLCAYYGTVKNSFRNTPTSVRALWVPQSKREPETRRG